MTKNIMFLKQCIRYVNHFLSLPILPTKENTHKKTPKKLPISGILSVSIFLETFHPSITIWTYCSFSRLHWSGYLKISFSLLWWVSCFLHHMVSSFLLYSIVLVKQTFYYFLIKESINVIFLRPCISENIFILPILNNSFHWIWPNSALEINFSPTTKGLVLWFSTFQCCQWEVWNHYVAILILNPLYVTYFFFPTEHFRIFKCSMKFHNMHWCWAKQSQILQFWVTFLYYFFGNFLSFHFLCSQTHQTS